MINLFLKAKHWQLFTLVFILPIAVQMTMMISIFSDVIDNPNPDPAFMLNYMWAFPIIMLLVISVNFGWLWSVAVGLQKKVPQNVTMKVKKFKIFFFIPLFYLSAIALFFVTMMDTMVASNPESIPPILAGMLFIIVPLHIFSIFCIFYSLYFVAKTIKTVELQREVAFGEFIGEFLMMWFYFIGIWFLQPKINRMGEELVQNNNQSTF